MVHTIGDPKGTNPEEKEKSLYRQHRVSTTVLFYYLYDLQRN